MSIFQSLLEDARRLNAYGGAIETGGQLFEAWARLSHGKDVAAADRFAADQLRVNAGQAQAAAQRDAYEINQKAEYLASAALATAAASGGGASDPTVINLIARNAAQMSYRAKIALYQGDERARSMLNEAASQEYAAQSSEQQGKQGAIGSLWKAGTSLLKGQAREASMRSRYGFDMPGVNDGL